MGTTTGLFWLCALIAVTAAAGCQARVEPRLTAALGEPVDLGVGWTATLPDEGLTLVLLRVLGDDRCPTQAVCEWEGEARLEVAVQAGEWPTRTMEMSTYPWFGEDHLVYDKHVIRLQAVTPYPEDADEKIPVQAYRATLQVDAVDPSPHVVWPELPFYLQVGQSATLAEDDMTVTWTQLVDDSRCPTRVTCVWNGEAVLAFTVTASDGDTTQFNLSTNPGAGKTSYRLGAYSLELIDVTPHPEHPNVPLYADEYAARLLWVRH